MDFVKEFLKKADAGNLRRKLRPVAPVSARECIVDGRKCIDFSSNNYLALSDHPKLKEAAVRWTNLYGAGSKGSRLVTGTFPPYMELERKIAAWKGSEASLVIGSGFLANIGAISAVADRDSAIFADKLNHASLNSGAQLSGAGFRRYRHLDLKHLEALMHNDSPSRRIIISDTVFSMDGDLADVQALKKISHEHGAMLYLDDAHATGVFGCKGEGLASGAGDSFISMGTFSKAMGSYGAYVACSEEMKEYLVNRCGTFVFSTALPPAAYGAIDAAVDLVQSQEYCEIRRNLLVKSAKLAEEIRWIGFDTGNTATPIIPVIAGDPEKVLRISRNLLEKGMLVVAIRPPTVPKGSARLRLSLNSAHTDSDISRLLEALEENL